MSICPKSTIVAGARVPAMKVSSQNGQLRASPPQGLHQRQGGASQVIPWAFQVHEMLKIMLT
jgi:hypothetical protein